MHDPVDRHLTRLASIAMPAALDTFETDLLAAIHADARVRAAGRATGLWSVAGALALGLVGGTALGGGATPAQAASPIGIDMTLAPSTLLLGR